MGATGNQLAFKALYQGSDIILPDFHILIEPAEVEGRTLFAGFCLDFGLTEYTSEVDPDTAVDRLFRKLCAAVTMHIQHHIMEESLERLYDNAFLGAPGESVWFDFHRAEFRQNIEALSRSLESVLVESVPTDRSVPVDVRDLKIAKLRGDVERQASAIEDLEGQLKEAKRHALDREKDKYRLQRVV